MVYKNIIAISLCMSDPNDVDSPRSSMNVQTKYGQVVQSQTVSPNAEDLSVILGSMQVRNDTEIVNNL